MKDCAKNYLKVRLWKLQSFRQQNFCSCVQDTIPEQAKQGFGYTQQPALPAKLNKEKK